MPPPFIPGLELSRRYFSEIIEPLITERFPSLRFSASLIGSGSDVLGFDTEMSMDHDWGPRLQIFLSEEDFVTLGERLTEGLADSLPPTFLGYPTAFALTSGAPVGHRIEITTIQAFIEKTLGFDIESTLEPADWLTFPEQRLLSIVAGEVFKDEVGLDVLRAQFAYFPDDIWFYLLASARERVGEEEHLVGRAGIVGDELGAQIIASRLVRDLMRICFLLERRFAPYPKWFGTAFGKLICGPKLTPYFEAAIQASGWEERNRQLKHCYRLMIEKVNAMKLIEPRSLGSRPFFERPFEVVELHSRFAKSFRELIQDPRVREIASRRNIGGIDLVSDNTALLCEPGWRDVIRKLYE